MMLRRARPTVRLLREDLKDGWQGPRPHRIENGDESLDLHPLSELPHPIIVKASSSFPGDTENENHRGPIASAQDIELLEVRVSQWRGAVWRAENGVCWLVAAGLAKGGHEDFDDFYEQIRRLNAQNELQTLMPDHNDIRLWKKEVASQLLLDWELSLQERITAVLTALKDGGSARFEVTHPLSDRLEPTYKRVATVEVEVARVREPDYEADEVVVTVDPAPRWASSDLLWRLVIRVLTTVDPPEQAWDRYASTYSTILESDSLSRRVDSLEGLIRSRALADSTPGTQSHRVHKRMLTARTVEGQATQALCGAFFVPRQDHETLPECDVCNDRLEEIDRFSST